MLLRVHGEVAILRLPEGREVTYPFEHLSDESRTRVFQATPPAR
jgi:hypothetical protein